MRTLYLGGSSKLHLLPDTSKATGVPVCGASHGRMVVAIPMTEDAIRDRINRDLVCSRCKPKIEATIGIPEETVAAVEQSLLFDSEVQARRKDQLVKLVDIYHRGKYGDYDDTYAEFEATYFGTEDGNPIESEECLPIPRYVSLCEDETYGMIHVFDSLFDALDHQADVPHHGDTLNVPAGIVDLDTGERVQTVSVEMTPSAFAVVCGLVQPSSEGINTSGIFSGVWEELRHHFPVETFRAWAATHRRDDTPDGDFYDEDAGM